MAYRYILIEPGGTPAISPWGMTIPGYAQRPAAVRHAQGGLGVYDRREETVVVEPNAEERIAHLMQQARAHEARALKLRDRIIKIQVWQELNAGSGGRENETA